MKRFTLLFIACLASAIASGQDMFFIKNIDSSSHSTYPGDFFECNGKTIFAADSGTDIFRQRRELWVTDGTAGGTKRLTDKTFLSTYVQFITVPMGNKVYFFVLDPYQLWVTDGTPQGTSIVYDFGISYAPAVTYFQFATPYASKQLVGTIGSKIYFNGYDPVAGWELFESDGTQAGTKMVKNIYSTAGKNSNPCAFVNYNGALYFTAFDASNFCNLWKTDGTFSGTTRVVDLSSLITYPIPSASFPNSFININNKLYFIEWGYGKNNIWQFDGTSASLVFSDTFYNDSLKQGVLLDTFKNKLLVITQPSAKKIVYTSDGTDTGTIKLGLQYDGTSRQWITEYHDKFFLTCDDGLYISDGTPAGSHHFTSLSASNLIVYNNQLYFTAGENDSVAGLQYNLYKTDEDSSNLQKIIPPFIANANPSPGSLAVCNGSLYFNAAYTSQDFELYRIGPDIFPAAVKNINATVFSIYPNPGDGSFTLDLKENAAQDATVKIYNILGGLVESRILENSFGKNTLQINTSGTYILQLITGGTIYTEKIIVRQ